MKKKRKKEEPKKKPKINPDLEGFDLEVDSFGEINATYDIDKINTFLNKNVEDKKLMEREDYDDLREGKPQAESSQKKKKGKKKK